jgi:hypothetical protein
VATDLDGDEIMRAAGLTSGALYSHFKPLHRLWS